MDDANSSLTNEICVTCGNVGLLGGDDGFFYCGVCGCCAEDMFETGVAEEDFVGNKGHGRDSCGPLYSARHSHRIVDPTYAPSDLKFMDYCNNVRMSYVYGLQLMINLQIEALVEKFNVSPLVCGIYGSIWPRYVQSTRVFDDKWGDEVKLQSESEIQGYNKMYTAKAGGKDEPRNNFNQRMVLVWLRALQKKIPLSCSLAITYLCCHIAREAVLETDIERWSLEGKLPYLAAFVEIEKTIKPTRECPLTADSMFRPNHVFPCNKLVSLAANIAKSVGMSLSPVNFYTMASRYLNQMSLPVHKILPYACSIHEWSMPPGLWLSTREKNLPPRVFVMAILIVTIKTLYNLNVFGKWEASLVNSACMDKQVASSKANTEEANDLSSAHKLEDEASHMLCNLQKKCGYISEDFEYSKDLTTYLKYCKSVVFGGMKPDVLEEETIQVFWDCYLKSLKDSEMEQSPACKNSPVLRPHEVSESCSNMNAMAPEDSRERSIRSMKLLMEENKFRYIPPTPRKNKKQVGYVHYKRKNEDGSFTYAAHADYYILLHACAREAQVDVRMMHQGVMSLEKKLCWIEKQIETSLGDSSQA